MTPRQIDRNPMSAYQRKAVSARRVGEDTQCACGESRPEALIAGRKPAICAACQRREQGKKPTDAHHIAGKSNSPITIEVPVNDHRALLSVAQLDWPKATLDNPSADELLKAAGSLRGFINYHEYLVSKLLLPLAEHLETLAAEESHKYKGRNNHAAKANGRK
jgi:hypothetical protein